MKTNSFLLRAGDVVKGPFPNLPEGYAKKKNLDNKMKALKEKIDKSVDASASWFAMSHGGPNSNQADMMRTNARKQCLQHLQDVKEGVEEFESMLKELPPI